MEIHLHVGVHKTATTYLQQRLKADAPSLRRAGIGYAPLGRLRPFLTRQLMSFTPGDFRIEEHLGLFYGQQSIPAEPRIIISDENLIGYCGTLVRDGQPFRNGPERLAHLRRLLAGHRIRLFVAIRSYDTFLASAYSEGLRNLNTFIDVDSFRRRIDIHQLRWPQLIADLADAVDALQIRLWRFEDFGAHLEAILQEMAFDVPVTACRLAGPERPSFSQLAVDVLESVAREHGVGTAGKLIGVIDQALPKDRDHPAFNPWSLDEQAALADMYAQDCASIPQNRWLVSCRSTQMRVASETSG
jgi:hypothetical protein